MFYQTTRTAKAAVIGTIMPWTGPRSNIPDGWILCDGSTLRAADYPLLVQVIGDTYNSDPNTSTLGGAFPEYLGDFVLPNLIDGKVLMDIEEEYFGVGGRSVNITTQKDGQIIGIDEDVDSRNIIAPYIGDNTDLGYNTSWPNVSTDVVFTLNDRNGYVGSITGNTIIPGQGEQEIYIGGRKLGTRHIRTHSHNGSYETINNTDPLQPGEGVVPYDNISSTWTVDTADWSKDEEVFGIVGLIQDGTAADDSGLKFGASVDWEGPEWSELEGKNGFGNGIDGRTLARVHAEKPPLNIRPKNVMRTPIWANLVNPRIDDTTIIPYGSGGSNINVPDGLRNYYVDEVELGETSQKNYNTFVSNRAATWDDEALEPHTHDSFTVEYQQASLKPFPRLTADMNLPSTVVLDNATNVGALQITMDTSQPSVTCLYIIRAY